MNPTTGFVTGATWRVPHVENELFTLPEHLSSPPVFNVVRVARSLVFCVLFCRSLFVPLSCLFCPLCYLSSIYGFWLPLCYLQTFLRRIHVKFENCSQNCSQYWRSTKSTRYGAIWLKIKNSHFFFNHGDQVLINVHKVLKGLSRKLFDKADGSYRIIEIFLLIVNTLLLWNHSHLKLQK